MNRSSFAGSRFFRYLFICFAIVLVLSNAFHCQMSDILSVYVTAILLFTFVYAMFSTNLKTLMIGVTALCVCFSVWTTNWPLKARFVVSKPAFEKVRSQIELGSEPKFPRMIGLFRIKKVNTRNKGTDRESVCFDLGNSGDFQGVAYCAQKVSFNIWTHIELDDHWHFIVED